MIVEEIVQVKFALMNNMSIAHNMSITHFIYSSFCEDVLNVIVSAISTDVRHLVAAETAQVTIAFDTIIDVNMVIV